MFPSPNPDCITEHIIADLRTTNEFGQNTLWHMAHDVVSKMPKHSLSSYMFLERQKNSKVMLHRIGRLERNLNFFMCIVQVKRVIAQWKHVTWMPGGAGHMSLMSKYIK